MLALTWASILCGFCLSSLQNEHYEGYQMRKLGQRE